MTAAMFIHIYYTEYSLQPVKTSNLILAVTWVREEMGLTSK